MTAWTDAEVFKLIDLWKEEGIQEQLEGSTRNRQVYEKLTAELSKAGSKKTGEQCRSKVKKLHQEYKEIKDNNGLTGRGRSKWKYYDVLNEILGNRPATRPPVVINTTSTETLTETNENPTATGDAELGLEREDSS